MAAVAFDPNSSACSFEGWPTAPQMSPLQRRWREAFDFVVERKLTCVDLDTGYQLYITAEWHFTVTLAVDVRANPGNFASVRLNRDYSVAHVEESGVFLREPALGFEQTTTALKVLSALESAVEQIRFEEAEVTQEGDEQRLAEEDRHAEEFSVRMMRADSARKVRNLLRGYRQ